MDGGFPAGFHYRPASWRIGVVAALVAGLSCFAGFVDTAFADDWVIGNYNRKVQVGKDQEKAQSEKDSHSKNRGGKKLN